MRFPDNLIPDGWVEAIDPDSGLQYYWDNERGRSQWHEPAAYRDPEAVEEEEEEGAPHQVPADKGHKPPRPGAPAPGMLHVVSTPSASSASSASVAEEEEEEEQPKPKSKPAKAKAKAEPEYEQEKEEEEVVAPVKAAKPAKEVKAASAPAPAPVPAPAPAPKAAAKKDDEEDEAEEAAPADAVAIEQYAAVAFGGGRVKESVVGGGTDVDLSALAGAGQSEREKVFFETMKKNAEEKKKAEKDALKVCLALPLSHCVCLFPSLTTFPCAVQAGQHVP
jgi:hypothetical protein